MKRGLYFILTMTTLIFWSSCRKDFEFEPSTGGLEFSKDTVYLDTVFSNIGSSTYNLKVYNRSNTDIVIPTVKFSEGQSSNYRMTIDGRTGSGENLGKHFENVEILAKDSMYIFIETTVDFANTGSNSNQFLDTDAIEFDEGVHQQKVELVTLIKDAVFIYPQQIINEDTNETIIETLTFDVDGDGIPDETSLQGRFLTNNELTFTNEKPYVIYGYAAVDENNTLTMQAGARVHFHANSGLIVTNNATLNIEGELSSDQTLLENEVIIQGDRLEPLFEDVPGQWGTIWLYNGSGNHNINYTTIKNGTVGILCEGNQNNSPHKLTIKNSQIYNSSNFGILARATSILGENLVINNSGQSSLALTYGGIYTFTHSTIANYWNTGFRQYPALLVNNYIIDEDENIFTNDLSSANFNNCIIYGNDNPEFLLDEVEGSMFNFKFTNCLARFSDNSNNFTGDNYNFNDPLLYDSMIFNQNPEFLDPFENNLIIGENSAAINTANPDFSILVPEDLLGVNRVSAPDIGAYQHVIIED